MDKLMQNPAIHALLLGLFALCAAALLASGDMFTRDEIRLREAEDLQRSLAMVIPQSLHDNNPLDDMVQIKGSKGATGTIYRARKGGKVVAVAMPMTVRGYASISLIMGIDKDGRVLGVRVLKHEETPGLGDKIEARKSDWIKSFDGRSLANTSTRQWDVKKNGGLFDQFSGATITPRAVVKAVRRGLQLFKQRKARLLNGKAADIQGGEGA